ncbi:HdeD family acid-resistance protein [Pseudorhodoferax sp.]|uniref:HdeD family acid-resistance protein n=1 Tax=Pseudorhodoferax sp. TaxID=1993553 RepID=UPI0039E556E2
MPSPIAAAVQRSWWVFLLYGLAAVVFGLLTLVRPGLTVIVLTITFGALSLVDGVVSLLGLARGDHALPRGMLVLYALVSIVFGVLALWQPAEMAAAMVWVLGVWLVVAGIARIVFAVQVRKQIEGEWLLALSGVLAIVLGVLFFVNPAAGLVTIALWIGAGALLYGVLQVVVALRLRRLARR